MPALIKDCVPMILRVRPAQFTMTRVSGRGANSAIRSTSSAPGQLMAVGMLIVLYSSNRRTSTSTTSAFSSISALTSCADREGVCCRASTNSPKDLLGTLTSLKSSPPAAAQARTPPAKTLTRVNPRLTNLCAARIASESSSGTSPSSSVTSQASRRGNLL